MDIRTIARDEVRGIGPRGLSPADRDDLEQAAALAAVAALRRLDLNRPESEQRAFVGLAARNAGIDFLRWRARRVFREIPELDEAEAGEAPDPVEIVTAGDALDRLCALVEGSGLSPRERAEVLGRLGFETGMDDRAADRRDRGKFANRARAKLSAAGAWTVEDLAAIALAGVFGSQGRQWTR